MRPRIGVPAGTLRHPLWPALENREVGVTVEALAVRPVPDFGVLPLRLPLPLARQAATAPLRIGPRVVDGDVHHRLVHVSRLGLAIYPVQQKALGMPRPIA